MPQPNQRQYKKNSIKLALIVGLTFVACVGGYYWFLYSDPVPKRLEPSFSNQTQRTELAIEKGDAKSLEYELVRLEQASGESQATPELIKQYQDRIEVSEKLMALDEPTAVARGIVGKITALSHWQFVAVTRGIEEGEQVTRLDSLAYDYTSNEDESVVEAATVAFAISGAIKYVKGYIDDFSEVEQRFESAALLGVDSVEVAVSIYRTSDWLRDQGRTDEAAKLYELLANSLAGSQTPAILAIGQKARFALYEIRFDLAQLRREIAAGVDDRQILGRVNNVVLNSEFDATAMARMLPMVELSLSWARVGLAGQLLHLLRSWMSKQSDLNDAGLKKTVSNLESRIALLGNKIQFRGLKSIGHPEYLLDNRKRFCHPSLLDAWRSTIRTSSR